MFFILFDTPVNSYGQCVITFYFNFQIGRKSSKKIQGLKNAKQIDKVSRVIFPLLFMVCFVFYCIFVLTL
jgi:hypothetical protein